MSLLFIQIVIVRLHYVCTSNLEGALPGRRGIIYYTMNKSKQMFRSFLDVRRFYRSEENLQFISCAIVFHYKLIRDEDQIN